MKERHGQLINCPVCNDALHVTELHCYSCQTTIKGDFVSSELNKLNKDQLLFVKTFLLCQGNIKEVEKKLSISYPTVKNKLSEIIDVINADIHEESNDVINILEEIENGLVGVDEAINKINQRRNLK